MKKYLHTRIFTFIRFAKNMGLAGRILEISCWAAMVLVTEITLTEGRSVYEFFLLGDAIPCKTRVYKSIEVEDGEKREREGRVNGVKGGREAP